MEAIQPVPVERILEQIVKIPVLRIMEDGAACVQVTPHEHQIVEHIVGRVKVMLQERMSDRMAEQIVEHSVSQFGNHIVEVLLFIPPERVQQRTVEQVDEPVLKRRG